MNAPWNNVGRKPLLNDAEVDAAAIVFKNAGGEKSMKKQVNAILVEKERRNGFLPESNKQYNLTTLSNYMALLATRAGITTTDKSIPKTDSRFTAERSLIGSESLAVVVAMTHFYVTAEESVEHRQMISELPEQDKLFYLMMCALHGNKPVRVRPSKYIFNADDTTDFICEGKQPDK